MSRIVKVSQSDYRVKVQDSGTITLDTGSNVGTVFITGNLIVQGESTTVNTTNLSIEDNIILLNNGETGIGITEGTSGLEIDRGALSNAQFVFDENVSHYDPLVETDVDGTFVFKTKDDVLSGIQLNSITTLGTTDLVFDMRNTSNILAVKNSDASTYANRLGVVLATVAPTAEDNYIPNKKFILGYTASGSVTPGVADVDKIYTGHGIPTTIDSEVLTSTSSVQFLIRSNGLLNQRAVITASGLSVDDVNLFGHTITSSGAYNLVLTANTNEVEVNAVLNLDDQAGTPSATGGKTKVFSKAIVGPGKSGLFFANNTTADELVAKNRALLFSMLF